MMKKKDDGRRGKTPVVQIKYSNKVQGYMARKFGLFAAIVVFLFVLLALRLVNITSTKGEQYKKQVLSQQAYDSTTIPYQRGAITDCNGTLLAYSEQVYNVILDSSMLAGEDYVDYLEPTLAALNSCYGLNVADVRNYILTNPTSKYHILKKKISLEEKQAYLNLADAEDSMVSKKGIWFEDEYTRVYPYNNLAADVIGFTTKDGIGQYGLEEYYNDTLAGNNGREYGYLSGDNALERTIIPAENGYTVVSTIDAHIQQICEENLAKFNAEHAGEYREGEDGSDNSAIIIMDIDSGAVLAMASYPTFNLNDPYDKDTLKAMGLTQEQINQTIQNEEYLSERNQRWKNFCISQSYEPGSVSKTFTIAAGLDCGALHDGEEYYCPGYIVLGEGKESVTIHCHNKSGEGMLDTQSALEQSCNVSLVQMNNKIGKNRYLEYFENFNFGYKTNIDLAGEMRTASLVFNENTMRYTELATASFGQGFNVTMIEEISAFCSVINGGYYYQPHMVSKILDDEGATITNVDPILLRQTVSESTSEMLRKYCIGVVENGTGKYARPAGYRIGGKTGTAERSGEGKRDYTISFMGFAPADDPQIAIYVVIDRPNVASQDTATRNACLVCRSVLQDVLPYMHIFMTEPLSPEERERLGEGTTHETIVKTQNDTNVTEEDTVSEEENSTETEDNQTQNQGEIPIIDLDGRFPVNTDDDAGIIQNSDGEDINTAPTGNQVDDDNPF